MSLLLPDDNYGRQGLKRSKKSHKEPVGLVTKLKALSNHPLFVMAEKDTKKDLLEVPTGKIRLVTNSWVDRHNTKK